MTNDPTSKTALEELYINQNKSLAEIATILKIGKTSVGRLLKKHHIPAKDLKTANSKKRKISDQTIFTAHNLYCTGLSLQTVASRFNLSPSRLSTLFHLQGLSTRSQKAAMQAFQERRRSVIERLYRDVIDEKLTVTQAAEQVAMSTSALYRAFDKLSLKLPMPNGYSITADDKQRITTMYLTMSPGEIASAYGVSNKYIRSTIAKAGLVARSVSEGLNLALSRGRRHGSVSKNITLKPELFDTWTPESAWVTGLLLADGSITTNNNHLMALGLIDLETIEKVADIIGYPRESIYYIERSSGHHYYQIQSGNRNLIEKLIRLGVTPRKSSTVRLPQHPEHMSPHLLRGYFDGDGSYSKGSSARFSLGTCSLTLAKGITRLLYEQAGISMRKRGWSSRNVNTSTDPQLPIYVSTCNEKPFYTIQTGARGNIIALYHYLYTNVDWSICMDRKRATLEAHLNSPPAPDLRRHP